jgi:hypothetical protein
MLPRKGERERDRELAAPLRISILHTISSSSSRTSFLLLKEAKKKEERVRGTERDR